MQPIHNLRFRSVSLILNPTMHSVDTLPLLVGTIPCGEILTRCYHHIHFISLYGSRQRRDMRDEFAACCETPVLDLPLTGTLQVGIEGFWNRSSHVPSDGNQHCSSRASIA